MKIDLTRDSVCAADDVDAPHSRTISMDGEFSVPRVLEAILRAGYLPVIAGGKASWVACSGIPLGVLAQQWPEPKTIGAALYGAKELDWLEESLRVHVSYLAQIDPEVVMSVVECLRLRA